MAFLRKEGAGGGAGAGAGAEDVDAKGHCSEEALSCSRASSVSEEPRASSLAGPANAKGQNGILHNTKGQSVALHDAKKQALATLHVREGAPPSAERAHEGKEGAVTRVQGSVTVGAHGVVGGRH
eukprot:2074648-Rhodomonas_salina.1